MVSLPITQSEQTELTQAPRSAVSGSYVSSAFSSLARGLDDNGQNFQAAQDEGASLRGANAVYRDDSGNLQVTSEPSTSQSGRLFNRSARQAYLAQTSTDARVALLDLRKKSNGDAAAFQAAYQGYKSKYLENADSLMAGPIAQTLDGEFNAQHEGMLQDQFKMDTANNKGKMQNEIDQLTNETSALARAGGTDSPEYQSKMDAIRSLYNEQVKNPLFQVTQADAEKGMHYVTSANMGEYITGQTKRIFDEKGYKAAMDFADKEIWDPKLNLTPSERTAYERQSKQGIQMIMAGRKDDLREAKSQAVDMTKSLLAQEKVDPQDFDELTSKLAALGDGVGAQKLLRTRIISRTIGTNSGMNNVDQVNQLEAYTKSENNPVIKQIVGVEGGDRRNPLSSADGYGNFIKSTWIDTVRKYEPSLMEGKTEQQVLDMRHDYGVASRMVANYTNENAELLQGHGFQATNGNVYLAHFAGGGGALALLSSEPSANAAQVMADVGGTTREAIEKANPFLKGMSADQLIGWSARKMGANIPAEVYTSLRKEVASDTKALYPKIIEGMKKSGQINPDEVALLFKGAALVGDEDFTSKIKTVIPEFAKFLDQNPTQMEADLHEMEAHSLTAMEQEVYDIKKAAYEQRTTHIKTDPVGLAMTEIPGSDPGPIPWGTKDVPDHIAKREKTAGTARELYKTPDVSVFRPAEAEAAAAKIYSTKPEDREEIISTLTNLKDDALMPTISSKPIMDALKAGSKSNDYGKYSSAMTAMQNAYRRFPQTFKQKFGDEALNDVQDWEARTKYSTPDEMRLFQQQQSDPAYAAQRDKLESKGHELAQKVDYAKIVDSFHDSSFNPLGNHASIDATDPRTMAALRADHDSVFAQRYAVSQDATQAESDTMDRLRHSWGISGSNGGRVMLHAPENVYIKVDGTHKWMEDETKKSLIDAGFSTSETTKATVTGRGVVSAAKTEVKPWPYTLIADQKTENAINAGTQPRWIVMVTDPKTGAVDFARTKDGKQLFMSYGTLAAAQAKAKANSDQDRVSQEQQQRFLKPMELPSGAPPNYRPPSAWDN